MKAPGMFKFKWDECRKEVAQLEALLARKKQLEESKDILPFFRRKKHASALIGTCFHSRIASPDRLAFEYSLYGDFTADLLVGNAASHAYLFVEFEDANSKSIFRRSPRKASEWSPRLEHGFGQVIDWFWKLDDLRTSEDFTRRFGSADAEFVGIVITGRSANVDTEERARLRWRAQNVNVGKHRVYCCTFDDLCERLKERIAFTDAI